MIPRIQMCLTRCLQGHPQHFLNSLSKIFRRNRCDCIHTNWKLPTRKQQLRSLKEQNFDVLVVGGGAVGCGCALDAASRGLKTALIEANDFASGASSKSSKLVEGNRQHLLAAIQGADLQQIFKLQQVLSERATMLKIAPHLNRVQPMLMPIYSSIRLPMLWMGLKLYDAMSGLSNLRASHFLSQEATLQEFPLLRRAGLVGSLVYYDSQMDDARMCLALALTAIKYDATVANYVKLHELFPVNSRSGCRKAVVEDLLTDTSFVINSRCMINASGAATDVLRKLDDGKVKQVAAQFKYGTHLALPNHFSSSQCGLILPSSPKKGEQALYMVPFENRTVVGCLEAEPEQLHRDQPGVSCEAVDFLLQQTRQALNECVLLCPRHVLSSWSGVIPTIMCPSSDNDREITSDFLLEASDNQFITLAGGSWSSYRVMASDAIDMAIDLCCLEPQSAASNTHNLLLDGGEEHCSLLPLDLVQNFDLPMDVAQHLAESYGSNAYQVLFKTTKDDWQRLHPHFPYIKAEVDYACEREYACQLVDVIARRLRVAFVDASAAFQMLPVVLRVMSKHLCWPACTQKLQLKAAKRFLMQQMGLGTVVNYNPLPQPKKKTKKTKPSGNNQILSPCHYRNILANAYTPSKDVSCTTQETSFQPIVAKYQTVAKSSASSSPVLHSSSYLPRNQTGIAPRFVMGKIIVPMENEQLSNVVDKKDLKTNAVSNESDRIKGIDQPQATENAKQVCEAKVIGFNNQRENRKIPKAPASPVSQFDPQPKRFTSVSKLNSSGTSTKQVVTTKPTKSEAAKSRLFEMLSKHAKLASQKKIKNNATPISELSSGSRLNPIDVGSSKVKENSNLVSNKSIPTKVNQVMKSHVKNLNTTQLIPAANNLKHSEHKLKTKNANPKFLDTTRKDIKRNPIKTRLFIKKCKFRGTNINKTRSVDDPWKTLSQKCAESLFRPTAQQQTLLSSKDTYYEKLKKQTSIRSLVLGNPSKQENAKKIAKDCRKRRTVESNLKAPPDLVAKSTLSTKSDSGIFPSNTNKTFNIPDINPNQP